MNHCEKEKGLIKKTRNKNRGYCGYIQDSYGEKKFIRSGNEYVVHEWLKLNNQIYSVETRVYEVGDKRYKPDFFIFKKGKISCIIEVKHHKNEVLEYRNLYTEFFKTIGIKYWVVGFSLVEKITRKYKLKEKIKKYKASSCSNFKGVGYDGKENPMFSLTHSEETKTKIGDKTKKRLANKEWKDFWLGEVKKKIDSVEWKENHKKGIKNRKPRMRHITTVVCPWCGLSFEKGINSSRIFCSTHCSNQKYSFRVKTGEFILPEHSIERKSKQMRNMMISLLHKHEITNVVSFFDLQCDLEKLRGEGVYPNNKPSKVTFFEKYFQDVNELNNELKRENNENY